MTENAAALFAARRARVLAALGEDGAMVLPAAPELRVGRDAELRYRPDPDLYYLTGYPEPEAVLVLTPGAEASFTLFVRPRDPDRELWTGRRGGIEGARERYGADVAYSVAELGERLPALLLPYGELYARLDDGRPEVDALVRRTLRDGRRQRQRAGKGPSALIEPGVILDEMRLFKDAHEIALMREAARISVEAFREAARAIRPGAGEWEVQAALESGFRGRGGDGPAFESIVASGANATVLHYVENGRRMEAGELVLLDAGASFHLYAADISRTFPVDGRFTPRQRALYDVVRAAHDAAIEIVRPGAEFADVHETAVRVLLTGLLDEGLLEGEVEELMGDEAKYRAFYPHRTAHWLGLDVHDVGGYTIAGEPRRLEPGMVFTIEPGLYVPETLAAVAEELRGTGIRVEDDVLVTDGGVEVLTGDLPSDAEAVAALVGEATR